MYQGQLEIPISLNVLQKLMIHIENTNGKSTTTLIVLTMATFTAVMPISQIYA